MNKKIEIKFKKPGECQAIFFCVASLQDPLGELPLKNRHPELEAFILGYYAVVLQKLDALQDILLQLLHGLEPFLLVGLLELHLPRVEEVWKDTTDGLENIEGWDAVEVFVEPLLQEGDPVVQVEAGEPVEHGVELRGRQVGWQWPVAILLTHLQEEGKVALLLVELPHQQDKRGTERCPLASFQLLQAEAGCKSNISCFFFLILLSTWLSCDHRWLHHALPISCRQPGKTGLLWLRN